MSRESILHFCPPIFPAQGHTLGFCTSCSLLLALADDRRTVLMRFCQGDRRVLGRSDARDEIGVLVKQSCGCTREERRGPSVSSTHVASLFELD
jgi:hypothetical protein